MWVVIIILIMITYRRRNLIRGTSYTLSRKIPADSKVLVKPGQEVLPETLVAQGKEPVGFRTVNLAAVMSLPLERVANVLTKTVGSRIYQDDVLARASKAWGLKEVVYRSPIDGFLRSYNRETGVLTLEYLPEQRNVAAGLRGEVLKVLPKGAVVIGSVVDRVHGLIGLGRDREGIISVIGYRDIPLEPSHLNERHLGKIVVGGTQAPVDFYSRALRLGVRAVVSGGVDMRVYYQLKSSLGHLEDVGLTIIATEGYGNAAIEETLYRYLAGREGQYAFVTGRGAEVIFPSSGGAGKDMVGDKRKQVWEARLGGGRDFSVLKEGQKVRILVGENRMQYGIVAGVDGDQCTVNIESEPVQALVRNVEILS